MEFYPLKIRSVKQETTNAVSIAFEVPENLRSVYQFKAGQYITLKTAINGQEVRRDYSLCTNAKDGELKVVVKAVDGGVFSRFANTELSAGDILDVATPNGRFTYSLETDADKTLMLFAAGSGITPIMSIIKTSLEVGNNKVILVYGNKTINETIFHNELNTLQNDYPERFQVQYIYSQENNDDALFGRIDSSIVKYALNQNGEADLYFLCGPEAMIHLVSEALSEKGVSKDCIKFELFTTSAQNDSVPSQTVAEGDAFVKVLVDDEETTFTMSKSNTILEAALKNNVDAPYSCQGGICSSCIAKLTDGEVSMRQNNILTDSEVADGLILTCQSEPLTSHISVDYDDV